MDWATSLYAERFADSGLRGLASGVLSRAVAGCSDRRLLEETTFYFSVACQRFRLPAQRRSPGIKENHWFGTLPINNSLKINCLSTIAILGRTPNHRTLKPNSRMMHRINSGVALAKHLQTRTFLL